MKCCGLFFVPLAAGWLACAPQTQAAGKYTLAYWREVGAYENQAPPAGQYGMQSAFVHVWDEQGQPLAGKQIYTSWGVLLGATGPDGFTEIVLNRPNGYDFQVRDGANLSDTTPVFSVERAPSWGHYSFELGFLFKQNAANPGVFDTNYLGIINASGPDPCANLSAPHTRSLAFYSTVATNYCGDAYALGNWAPAHGQTFVATGNRIVAVKALMAAGDGVHLIWNVQIYEGGPNGPPIGPMRSTRDIVTGEDFPVLVRWGINDVQVVPGRSYYMRVSRPEGLNAYHVTHDNYAGGNYFENDVVVSGVDLMGLVVCATYTNSGPTGTLTGHVYDASNQPMSGVLVNLPDAALYTTSAADGAYTIPFVPAGAFDVQASKTGYVTGLNTGVVVRASLVTTSSFVLNLQGTNIDSGIIATPLYNLQPFEIAPVWSSSFDAVWGGAGTFQIVSSGQTGNALQVSRAGPGSSARVQVFGIKPSTPYQFSVWARCPSSSATYWAECAFKLGSATADNFDQSPDTWTLVKKFSSSASENGNNSTWTRYTANFNSGANSQVSVGFKLGASSGTGPVVQWDQLAIVSLVLPAPTIAVADSPSNVTVRFAAPLDNTAATNLSHYGLQATSGPLSVLSATLGDPTNLTLTTAPQIPRRNYTLTISNLTMAGQPPTLTGLNGQLPVRVPWRLIPLDSAALWKYHDAGSNLLTAWRASAYDDSTWREGAPLFGYSSGALPAPILTPLDPVSSRYTVYFRKQVRAPMAATNAPLRLLTVLDDGGVFWLNGAELCRIGMSTAPPTFASRASRTVGIAAVEGPFDLISPPLLAGMNVLAAELHQSDPASPDAIFGFELDALLLPSQIPVTNASLTITRDLDRLLLTWPESGMVLQWSTNLLGPWTSQPEAASPVTFSPSNPASFFRLGFE